ncbi:MAG: Omp28-related outer membrane protein [Saprospiraceae bacterium]
MKNLYLSLLFLFSLLSLEAQTTKYPLLEHFTNSRCGICASRNPAFYSTLSNYEGKVHHIAIHPSVPYTSCVFYQANKEDNDARKDYYAVFGTPQVFVNGTRTSGSQLITTAQLDSELTEMSNLGIQVTETNTGGNKVDIEVFSMGTPPSGNLRIFAALVEKKVNYQAPNGENVHHDVLRKFLTSNEGDAFTPAADGGKVDLSFNYTIESGWMASEMYVLVWVQDWDTKEVFNSGTKFNERISSVNELDFDAISISPNPASDFIQINTGKITLQSVQMTDLNGRVLKQIDGINSIGNYTLHLNDVSKGIYLLRAETSEGVKVEKVVLGAGY